MTKWLQAIFLMALARKAESARQLMRTLETTYKTAGFLAHRIREAMCSADLAPFGSTGRHRGGREIGMTSPSEDKRSQADKFCELARVNRR